MCLGWKHGRGAAAAAVATVAAAGGIITLAVQPEPSRNEGETGARIISTAT